MVKTEEAITGTGVEGIEGAARAVQSAVDALEDRKVIATLSTLLSSLAAAEAYQTAKPLETSLTKKIWKDLESRRTLSSSRHLKVT